MKDGVEEAGTEEAANWNPPNEGAEEVEASENPLAALEEEADGIVKLLVA